MPPPRGGGITSCRRAAATIYPRRGLQQKRAAAALTQASRARPDQPIRAIQPAAHAAHRSFPLTHVNTRQTSDIIIAYNDPWAGHNKIQETQLWVPPWKGKEGGEGKRREGMGWRGGEGKGGEGVPECPNPELASLCGRLLF